MTRIPEYRHTAFHSPVGTIHLLAGQRGLVAVSLSETWDDFKKRCRRRYQGSWVEDDSNVDDTLKSAVQALNDFFDKGIPLPDDIPLDPIGTPFQRKVWDELRKISHGNKVTYSQIAGRIGSPRATRAVGGACKANPIPLFIPCHRIVGVGGSLGGYSGGGVNVKRKLLALEGIK